MRIWMQGQELWLMDDQKVHHFIGCPKTLPTELEHQLTINGFEVQTSRSMSNYAGFIKNE